jgi:hypothetical protein
VSWVDLDLGPAEAVAAGAAWRINPTNRVYFPYTNYSSVSVRILVGRTGFDFEFKEIPGYRSPSNDTFVVVCDQGILIRARYEVVPPRLELLHPAALLVDGTAGTSYRIESAESLADPVDWRTVQTFALTNKLHMIPLTAPESGSARFYRAVWMPSP